VLHFHIPQQALKAFGTLKEIRTSNLQERRGLRMAKDGHTEHQEKEQNEKRRFHTGRNGGKFSRKSYF
jgi:hypothetical protein